MTLKSILEQIAADSGPIILIILIAATLIQISPIHINPWGALARWLGNQLNKNVLDKVAEIESRLNSHIQESSDFELRNRRAAILDFSSSIIRGTNYHKEKFDFMIAECDSYEAYCHDNGVKNGVAEASISEIRRVYQEHLHNGDFLMEKGAE